MKTRVRLSAQAQGYLAARAPAGRRMFRAALKSLASWNGRADPPRIRFLEDELNGYVRLRVGAHRVIFAEASARGRREIQCIFAGPRSTVYEAFAELVLDELTRA
jgi:hypothetical protein